MLVNFEYRLHWKEDVSRIVVTLSSCDTLFAFQIGVIMRVELVTTLKRQATKILADLHISKEPVLITEYG